MARPVNGAALLARALREARCGPIFTLSGNQILPIYDAGLDEDLVFIDTRHEAPAVYMADAWARVSGRPGVCLVTAGPGFTNALSGVAAAWLAESPLVFLSGGSTLSSAGRGGFQELDQVALARPVCKQAWLVTRAADIPAMVAQAFRTAVAGTPGPVHLTLPSDVLLERVDLDATPPPLVVGHVTPPAPPADIARAVDLLQRAERPLVLAGPSVWREPTVAYLRALLDATCIPAFNAESARGLSDPLLHGLGPEVGRADVVLLIGAQDFVVGFGRPPVLAADCRVIHVASDAARIGFNTPVEVGLCGDPGVILQQLLQAWPAHSTRAAAAWSAELESIRSANVERLAEFERAPDVPIHPLRVAAEVRAYLRAGDCVALDGGEFGQWARWGLADGPWTLLTNGKLGGIGSGLSLAMAAALARPEARAVAFVGDGTFGFHGLELDTAVRHHIPVLLIVGNDAGWASERHRQRAQYGPHRLVAADLLATRYDLVAKALGAHGELVERPDDLPGALERAFASGGPACINVAIASVPSPAANH